MKLKHTGMRVVLNRSHAMPPPTLKDSRTAASVSPTAPDVPLPGKAVAWVSGKFYCLV